MSALAQNPEYLTQEQVFEIFKACKPTRFAKEPNFDKVGEKVSQLLNVPVTERLIEKCKLLFQNDYVNYMGDAHKKISRDRKSCTNKLLFRKDFIKRKFEDVSPRQQARRMSEFDSVVKKTAKSELVSPTKLLTRSLMKKYPTKKKTGKVAKSLFKSKKDGDSVKSPISNEQASAIYEAGKLSQRSYTNIRLILKNAGHDILPTYNQLENYRKTLRPQISQLPDSHKGVQYDYPEAIKLTTQRIFATLPETSFKNLTEVVVNLHDGLDGSGGHSIFNQKGNAATNNIIMYMFRVESIIDAKNKKKVYENSLHCSENSARPVMLIMGKESRENITVAAKAQMERRNTKFTITHNNKEINATVNAQMSMVDGKLDTLMGGYGGAYCTLCTSSKENCHDIKLIKAGFKIDRTLENTLEVVEKGFHLEENREKDDYSVRFGITQEPITTENMNFLHPLHKMLRMFG